MKGSEVRWGLLQEEVVSKLTLQGKKEEGYTKEQQVQRP